MGGTLMCGVSEEIMILNEETVWSSQPGGEANPEMPAKLETIKQLFPDNAITRKTPELYKAIQVTLAHRLSGGLDAHGQAQQALVGALRVLHASLPACAKATRHSRW